MAYSDFTIDRLSADFGVDFQGENLFSGVPPLEISAWLTQSIEIATQIGFGSEKSRSERLVSPVLTELAHRNNHKIAVVSGGYIDIDPARGLNGECDFVLSFTRLQDFIKAPVFCVTKAKKQDIEYATVQCAAQLIGADRLNKRDNKPLPILYGCSTTGVEWRFLRFENNVFTLDEARYLINEPTKLLGILQHIVDQTRPA